MTIAAFHWRSAAAGSAASIGLAKQGAVGQVLFPGLRREIVLHLRLGPNDCDSAVVLDAGRARRIANADGMNAASFGAGAV
jgi:hypothetical protein